MPRIGEFGKFYRHTQSVLVLSGEAVYDDNGTKRKISVGDTTWTPSGTGHGVDNSAGTEDFVFMALIVKQ